MPYLYLFFLRLCHSTSSFGLQRLFNMDIKMVLARIIASLFIFMHTSFGLIVSPYKTIRTQSISDQNSNGIIIFLLTLLYFVSAKSTRYEVLWGSGLAFVLFVCTVSTLALLPGEGTFQERFKRYLTTWTLTYIPTLLWFYASFYLFLYFPPPRTQSLPGVLLSILFLAYSLSLLAWKVILVYFSIRFSSRIHLYRVLYYMFLYLAVSIPLWILLYNLRIFRIPFV